jgi:pimeloyl-ACP methyl ester carboxylesterase
MFISPRGAAVEIAELEKTRRMVPTRFGQIACLDVGEGPPALFVHGVFLNGLMWRNVFDEVRHERRCIAVDTLGHGATRVMPGQEVSLPAQAEMLEALCAELGLDQIDLVANDTGGAIAQIFAARHPERLRTLTLTNCDTQGNLPPAAFAPVVELAGTGSLGPLLSDMAVDVGFARSELGLGSGYERPQELSEAAIHAYLAPLVESPEAIRNLEAYITTLDERELIAIELQLKVLTVPTLIVWGTADQFCDVSFAYWLRDTIPGVRELIELPGAKLFFPEERPAELGACLLRHWAV